MVSKQLLKVLIVEQDQDVAEALKLQIEKHNYMAEIASDLNRNFPSAGYDLIVLDVDTHPIAKIIHHVSKDEFQSVLCIGSVDQIQSVADQVGGYLIKDRKNDYVRLVGLEIDRSLKHKQLMAENQLLIEDNKRLTQGIEDLAQTLGHEMKSPMSTIAGYASVLVSEFQTMPEEESTEFLKLIETMSTKASHVIDDLLLLATIRHIGDLPLKPINIDRIMNAVNIRLRDVILDTKSEITVQGSFPSGIGYEPWVEEVIVNLVSNAIKYGGSPPIIMVGGDAQSSDFVRFWVRDNGKGLTTDEISQLFTPFTRLTHTDVEGHGLGLSIVSQIIDRLGGGVGVDSKPGQGSTFYFTLPRD